MHGISNSENCVNTPLDACIADAGDFELRTRFCIEGDDAALTGLSVSSSAFLKLVRAHLRRRVPQVNEKPFAIQRVTSERAGRQCEGNLWAAIRAAIFA